MRFRCAVTSIGVAVLLAFVVLGPLPAAAGPVVYQSNMVCADVDFGYGIEISQRDANATARLEKTGAGDSNLSLTIKSNGGLPPSAPVVCALVCVLDGFIDLFEFEKFKPCGTTTAGGKLTTTATLIDFDGEPFNGGCLLPVPAFWIFTYDEPLVLCAPGFGLFGLVED